MTSNEREGKAAKLVHRPEEASDQPFLLALFVAARAEQFAPLNLPAPMLDMLMRQQFQAQSSGYQTQFPSARREIVEADGVPVGRLFSDRDDHRLHLVDIAMAPAWRSVGLGSRLIRQLMDEAREAGVPLTLQVACDNVRAVALYERLGFKTIASDGAYSEMRWTR